MSYSCSDFTDDVLTKLAYRGIIDGETIPDDDPQAQAALVLDAIDKHADLLRSRAAHIAEIVAEREDWARRFKLDGVTPWEWMTRANRAEGALRKIVELSADGASGARAALDAHRAALAKAKA